MPLVVRAGWANRFFNPHFAPQRRGGGFQGCGVDRKRFVQFFFSTWLWGSNGDLLCGRMKLKAYARAGVDIDLGNKVKATLPQLLASTCRPGVLGKVGGFGGLFALDTKKYRA